MAHEVLAQSASQLTVSTQEWSIEMFADSVKRAAERQAKNTTITRERHVLNRGKLVTAVCADYRAHFASLYGKTERLPSAIFSQIESAVDNHINGCLKQVHSLNAVGYRRAFFHKANDMEITERVQVTGENKLSLKEQLLGVTIFIAQNEKRLKDLEAKPTPDYEHEKQVKQTLMKLNVTKSFIEGEIANQKTLTEQPVS